MIRPTEIRDSANGQYATRQRGFDKHWGLAVCYITVGDKNMYWWTRVTVNTAVTLRENTDACSEIKQYQVIREDALSIDLESMIPGNNNTVASDYLDEFQAGTILTNFHSDILEAIILETGGGAVTDAGVAIATPTVPGKSAYGAFMIESTNVEFSRDDFSSLRLTIRAMGYGDMDITKGTGDTNFNNGLNADYDAEAGIV